MKGKIGRGLAATLLLAVGVAFDASAVKAKPGIIDYEQPDGSVIQLRLHGDERSHYATSEDGYLLIPNGEGGYEYAIENAEGQPISSGIAVRPLSKRSSAEINLLSNLDKEKLIESVRTRPTTGRRYAANSIDRRAVREDGTRYVYSTSVFPVKGEAPSLVILVEYPDYGFSMDDPNEYYKRFLNGETFTDHGGTSSCRQYFIDNSMGQFKPNFDLYGPVMLKYNRSYYGSGDEYNAHNMVVEAVKALDPEVDFSIYDTNKDGYVDNVYIIYANTGEADGGPESSVWPYSYELELEGVRLQADGVKFNLYGCSNELTKGKPCGIGTFTHEFCHVLGLPDLYNTQITDYSTPGDWSVLDGGPYNNDGRTPPCMSIFERYSLGWADCPEIVASGDYIMEPVDVSNTGYMMTTEEKKTEFYMLENRQKEGWDRYLPGHGMLVWHIDFVQRVWDFNAVNDRASHQYVKLVCADNIANGTSYSGDSYPGRTEKTELSTETEPRLESWLKTPLNVTKISGIAENDGRISFTAKLTEERGPLPGKVESVAGLEGDLILYGRTLQSTIEKSVDVYDLSGRKIGNIATGGELQLEPGLYIAGGKKFVVR